MPFFAYVAKSARVEYDARKHGENARALLSSSEPALGESETREEAEEIAYAYLGRHPAESVYVTDSDHRVVKYVFNSTWNDALERQGKWHFMAWALLFFALVCFVATVVMDLGWGGVLGFLVAALCYVGCVGLKIQNEVESAVVVAIILLLIVLLLPAVRQARERKRSQEQSAAETPSVSYGPGTSPAGLVPVRISSWNITAIPRSFREIAPLRTGVVSPGSSTRS